MHLLYLRLKNWCADEAGQDLIEYALIAVLIVLVVVASLSTIAPQLNIVWDRTAAALQLPGSQ
jgi:Flp pilus assembly pilin Flp